MLGKVLVLIVLLGACNASCVSSGDQNTINALFKKAGDVVSLCAGATISLTGSINFNAPNQEISTQGYPTDASRATLVVTGATQANAISGCGSCSGIKIRNIQVNGNRPALGVVSGGAALIEIGGTSNGQIVDHIHALEPRGWSCLHIFEGNLDCRNATITNNQIGPSGNSNGTWADGISMACTNSLVANNVITDATDGAIVVFGAPGTRVTGNTIIASTRVLLGGINMVDFGPYNGNYNGAVVSGNTINAQGAQIKVGIACGPLVWGDDSTDVNFGGTVTQNTLTGNYMAYGIAAAGVRNFTITNNPSTAQYSGKYGSCPNPPNAPPMAFVYNAPYVSASTLQSNFVVGRVHFQICIQPGLPRTLTYSAGQIDLLGDQKIQLDGYTLIMQLDGNLVLDGPSGPVWSSGTPGTVCNSTQMCGFVFNTNGQLSIVSGSTTRLSFSSTVATGASLTISTSAPYLILNDGNGNILWQSSYQLFNFHLHNGNYVKQVSGGHNYYLTLTNSGNLAVYGDSLTGTLLWSSGLTGKTCPGTGCDVNLQGDGNLVIYGDSSAYWATGTNGRPQPVYAIIFSAEQPYVTLIDASGSVEWASAYLFTPDFGIQSNQYIFNSGNYLVLGSDANLAVRSSSVTGTVLWTTGLENHTCATSNCHAGLQYDGNFVLYTDQGAAWSSGTSGVPNVALWRFNEVAPYLQLLDTSNSVVWSS